MHLKVSSPERNYPAFSVKQRFAAFTNDKPVGTTKLFNCMGIVIHNWKVKCGVVAHIEAVTDSTSYATEIDSALKVMMGTLNTKGGNSGGLSVVVLGNASGGDAPFNVEVEKSIQRTSESG